MPNNYQRKTGRPYKKKTLEERILSLTPASLKFFEKVVRGKGKVSDATKLSVCKLILSMKLDKDKREGRSTSSYEGQLLSGRKEKK